MIPLTNNSALLNITLVYANAPVALSSSGDAEIQTAAKTTDAVQIDSSQQHLKLLAVAAGTTLYEALQLAGWLGKFSELDAWCESILASADGADTQPIAKDWRVGIYAQKQSLNYVLKDKDRIEVYRPLNIDPMKKRKNKAILKKKALEARVKKA